METTVSESLRSTTVEINGDVITIRPILKSDSVLEANFINNLSDEAKHYRFLGGVNHLSEAEIENLCDVDYHNSMAFVAILDKGGKKREIGVIRYHKSNDENMHEMAIALADEYLDTDLDTMLTTRLMHYASEHGVKSLVSTDLHGNPIMQHLSEEFNMKKTRDPEDVHQIIYSLKV